MYKKSIKDNSEYLVPFIEGIKYYGYKDIVSSCGTMMILNENGDVLTCGHIANEFQNNSILTRQFQMIMKEMNGASKKEIKEIEKKYNLKKDTPIISNINIPFNIEGEVSIEITKHKYLDLALLRFKNLNTKRKTYPIFCKTFPEQGQSICKLGYAFPNFDIFEYSDKLNRIILKEASSINSTIFPLDGIVTRGLIDEHNNLSMFETSTAGLRGQSGGPIFSPDGVVYGIQSMNSSLDLNFDIHKVVKRGLHVKKVDYTPFINLGIGVASTEIIKFLEENKVKYNSK